MELFDIDEDGNKIKSEKEIKQEREAVIKLQKERLAKEQKYKRYNNRSK
jgi:hypothetical protein